MKKSSWRRGKSLMLDETQEEKWREKERESTESTQRVEINTGVPLTAASLQWTIGVAIIRSSRVAPGAPPTPRVPTMTPIPASSTRSPTTKLRLSAQYQLIATVKWHCDTISLTRVTRPSENGENCTGCFSVCLRGARWRPSRFYHQKSTLTRTDTHTRTERQRYVDKKKINKQPLSLCQHWWLLLLLPILASAPASAAAFVAC